MVRKNLFLLVALYLGYFCCYAEDSAQEVSNKITAKRKNLVAKNTMYSDNDFEQDCFSIAYLVAEEAEEYIDSVVKLKQGDPKLPEVKKLIEYYEQLSDFYDRLIYKEFDSKKICLLLIKLHGLCEKLWNWGKKEGPFAGGQWYISQRHSPIDYAAAMYDYLGLDYLGDTDSSLTSTLTERYLVLWNSKQYDTDLVSANRNIDEFLKTAYDSKVNAPEADPSDEKQEAFDKFKSDYRGRVYQDVDKFDGPKSGGGDWYYFTKEENK